MPQLAVAAERLLGQPMFKLLGVAKNLEARGESVIHFEIGDSCFGSPPEAIASAQEALANGASHYVDSRGMSIFHEAISSRIMASLGFSPDLRQIAVAPANALIDFFIRCVANPGDEVIVPDPCFPTYLSVAAYQNISTVGIPLDEQNNFDMRPDYVDSVVSEKTRAIIMNSPHNPTGSALSIASVEGIAKIAEKRGLFLLSDEVYADLIFSKKHISPSLIDFCRERTIILGSLSKSHAMAGWRSGYLVGPEELIEKVGLLIQTVLSCCPPFVQIASAAALQKGDQHVKTLREEYRRRSTLLANGLNRIEGYKCSQPDGGMYLFPRVKLGGMTTTEYTERLLNEQGVCILPGEYFGDAMKDNVRFSIGSCNADQINDALNRINSFHEAVQI